MAEGSAAMQRNLPFTIGGLPEVQLDASQQLAEDFMLAPSGVTGLFAVNARLRIKSNDSDVFREISKCDTQIHVVEFLIRWAINECIEGK